MVITSAPGKILWIGGYAVLEKGNTAFVTGVDKRVFVKAEKSDKIHIVTPQFGIDISGNFDGSKIILDKDLSDGEKKGSSFVRCAIETGLRYLKYKGKHVSGLNIETLSDPAFGIGDTKTGLGGSAAITVATITALFELHGLRIDENKDLIHKMAQYVHFRVQGKIGSGFDVAAACFGGSVYSRYSPEMINHLSEQSSIEEIVSAIEKQWDYTTEELPLPEEFFVSIGNILGESTSTSTMVKKVNEWKVANPEAYKILMKELNEANKEAVKWLKQINKLAEDIDILNLPEEFDNFKKYFEKGRMLTKKLGELSGAEIETEELSKVIEQTVKHGAFVAKLPGAGGGDSIAALSFNKNHKHKLESYWLDCVIKQIEPLSLSISNEGIRIERQDLEIIKKNLVI